MKSRPLLKSGARLAVRRPRTKSFQSIRITKQLRCTRVSPTEDYADDIKALQTVGLRLNRAQARTLATHLLAAADDDNKAWNEMLLTGFRFKKDREGAY
ncbi:MAG TPA: hypothetical protein VGG64_24635 [Pirellulales bacterium]